ncbi:hypothetical protein AVEN_191574-1 [Araneus ventricosus]|uniref:Mariner Mos1 transposase n=1 Tax=Araneus ventricosus TaxID=182803 RepID=A0A4Y2UW61_ARAVE|nr:hypothetical protein AVEN_191574-1 [Araneus ventricosus]
MAWGHTGSPIRLRKARQTLSARKLRVTVFWDAQGILLIEFMTRGTTINSEVYCRTLKKLKRAIQNKRRGLLSSGVVLLHDNARPHTAVRTGQDDKSFGVIGRRGIKTLSLPPISVITVPFTTFLPRCVICNRVPLLRLGISRLRFSSTGTPTFNLGLSEGAPDNSKMLKTSTGYDVPC